MKQVYFDVHEIEFQFNESEKYSQWLQQVASLYSQEIGDLHYLFCSDEFVLALNQEHLQHDYYTDILTFDYRNAEEEPISGEIFISIDRVRENAAEFGVSFENELARVIVHGLLHLIGFDDLEEETESEMRKEEDKALELMFHVKH